jgi:hypothetical protein
MSPLPEWLLVWSGCGRLWCRSWLEIGDGVLGLQNG